MTTLKCSVFLIVVAVFCVHVECHGSKEGEGHYGGHYGGKKYGGENYGAGGGHYAIGFTKEEIAKMCLDNTECKNCYDQSQDVSGDARTLKVADVRDCFTKYPSNSGWMSKCADYANDMLLKYSDKLPPTVQNMVSFCARTSLDFSSATKCDLDQPWKPFYTCFTKQGDGKKDSHEGGSGSGEKGSEESGEGEKKGEEKRRRAAGIPIEGEEKRRRAAEIPIEGEEKRRRAAGIPIEGEEKRRRAAEIPIEGEEKRRRAAEIPIEGEEKRRRAAEIPIEGEEKRRRAAEIPVEGVVVLE